MSDQTSPVRTINAGRWRRVLAIAVVVLFVTSVTPIWRAGQDSAMYVLLARSIASGAGLTVFGQVQAWGPPGFPVLLAPMFLLPTGTFLAVNLFMAACAVLCVYLSYRLLRELTGPIWALALTAVVAFSAELHNKTISVLSDVPFMALVLGSLLLMMRFTRRRAVKHGASAGMLSVLSCWVRVLGVPFCAGLGAGLFLNAARRRTRSYLLRLILIYAILGGGVLLSSALYFRHVGSKEVEEAKAPSYVDYFSHKERPSPGALATKTVSHFYRTGEHLSRLFTGQKLPAWLALLLFWLPILAGSWMALTERRYIIVFSCWAYIGAILLLKPVLSRYLLPFMPLLLYFELRGIRWLAVSLHGRRRRRWLVPMGGLAILLAMNVPVVCGQIYEVHSIWLTGERRNTWARSHASTAEFLQQHMDSDDRFIATHSPQVLGVFCDCRGMLLATGFLTEELHPEELIAFAEEQGVTYWVIDRKRVPPAFQRLVEEIDSREDFDKVHETPRLSTYHRPAGSASPQERP